LNVLLSVPAYNIGIIVPAIGLLNIDSLRLAVVVSLLGGRNFVRWYTGFIVTVFRLMCIWQLVVQIVQVSFQNIASM